MGKREEGSVGDLKLFDDKQLENLEENQQEQVNSRDGLEFQYENYFRVSKETYNRVVLSRSKFLNRKDTGIFQNDKDYSNARFFAEKVVKQLQQ